MIILKIFLTLHSFIRNSTEVIHDYDNADTISIDTLALYEDIEEERNKEISELTRLSKKTCFLHTKLLYYRNAESELGAACHNAWRTIVKSVQGSQDCWRELGHYLGISQDDLNYIKHSIKNDPTDIVLKLFMQDEDATLDKILDVLVKMKRFDILKKIEDPVTEMVAYFNKDEGKSDTGYHSNNSASERKIITLKSLVNDLPPALNKSINTEKKPNQPQQLPPKVSETKNIERLKNDKPILFLTFTEDGIETAMNIQDKVNDWFDMEVQVITLEDRRDDVIQNPEKFIREYFEKADYIVPLITTGYMDEINGYGPGVPSTSDNLDCKYVNFIYNLISNQYMHITGCLNKKVRSVLPENADVKVLRNISLYPALIPWTHEMSFDEQFRIFLKDYST
ncbi:hypothetical protein JYU34_006005 [Plutella xylostella]|uniref:Death domain-containing protein n=1 Tax=Plutella xylostella TaxID=51655 RepID=A0ABQ7QUP8_PLUXY|nr:hypothetical protein JYU34_006005 [Plutella xylostella]